MKGISSFVLGKQIPKLWAAISNKTNISFESLELHQRCKMRLRKRNVATYFWERCYHVLPCVFLCSPVLPCVRLCYPNITPLLLAHGPIVSLSIVCYLVVWLISETTSSISFFLSPSSETYETRKWQPSDTWRETGEAFLFPALVSRLGFAPRRSRACTPLLKSEGCSRSTDIYVALLSLCLHRLFKQARGNSSYDRQRRLAAHWWCWALWWTWILLHCGSNQRTDQVQRISGEKSVLITTSKPA